VQEGAAAVTRPPISRQNYRQAAIEAVRRIHALEAELADAKKWLTADAAVAQDLVIERDALKANELEMGHELEYLRARVAELEKMDTRFCYCGKQLTPSHSEYLHMKADWADARIVELKEHLRGQYHNCFDSQFAAKKEAPR
jgi:hypothetical protein